MYKYRRKCRNMIYFMEIFYGRHLFDVVNDWYLLQWSNIGRPHSNHLSSASHSNNFTTISNFWILDCSLTSVQSHSNTPCPEQFLTVGLLDILFQICRIVWCGVWRCLWAEDDWFLLLRDGVTHHIFNIQTVRQSQEKRLINKGVKTIQLRYYLLMAIVVRN